MFLCLCSSIMFAQTHWVPQGGGSSGSAALVAKIQINGVDQTSDQLEVGVFCGTECRAAAIAQHWTFAPLSLDYYRIMTNVLGDAGDEFTFKLYDHATEEELTYLTSPAAISYTDDGWGSAFDPYVLNFTGTPPTTTYTITASANPTAGGTVTGAGTYDEGANCTLTATANTGYHFVNWTKNGTQVSTNATYTFAVTETAAFVANFALNSYTITASADPTAGGTVSGAGTFNHGASCTLTATPATGYQFVNWTKNGTAVSTNASYTFTVTEAGAYVAHFSQNTYTITASANPTAGGTISGTGNYTLGASCTLVATPATGYHFVNWTKNGTQVSTSASYTFNVTEAAAYVAHFALNSYAINATANPTAGGSVSGAGNYDYGTSCTLNATPATGYHFVNWTKNGTAVSTNASYTFTVTEAGAYVAHFSQNTYTITASANPTAGGTISGTGNYTLGASCTLVATPATGYHFVNWTKNGTQVSTSASYTFNVTEAAAYVAHFALNSYAINATANPTAGGSVSGAGNYDYGTSCTLNATPATGYHFVKWMKGGTQVSTNAEYTFTVTEAAAFVAHFEINSYTVSANTNPTGAGTITGAGSFNHGASCTLTVTPNLGYTFVNWTKNGTQVSTNTTYTFNVTETATYVANFTVNGYQITATADPAAGGTITGAGAYTYGTSVTLVATANTGYTFVNWTKNGTVVGTNPSYSLTVTEDAAYVAHFQINSYTVSASANPTAGGSVSGAGTFNHGANCTLTATANTGYHFVNWTKNGTQVSTSATYTFSVTETAAYVANFQLNSYQITASVNPAAAGTVTGTGTYNHGESCTLTVTPNYGYTFVNWTKNGTAVGTTTSITFDVTETAAYVANFTVNNYEISASANPAAGGSVTGAGTFAYNTSCTLTATANTGYTFIKWTKNGTQVSTNATYTFTVTEDATYVAQFQLNSYQITASVNPAGAGTVSGAGTYNHGASCTLTATTNPGHTFLNWTKNGTVVSTNTTYTFTVTEAGAYVANYSIHSHTITATADPTTGGSISGAGTYNYGTSVTLTASAHTGYTFVNWTKNGEVVGTNPTYTLTVTEDADYVAHFNLKSYEISAAASPASYGTVTGAGTYNHGETCTLTATANENYIFLNWTKNGTVVSTNPSYSFTVTANASFVANFVPNEFQITVTSNPSGAGTLTGGGTYMYGATATLSATAHSSYTFIHWTKDGSIVSTNPSFSFVVTESGNYVAHFSHITHEITATANPTAGGTVEGAGIYGHGMTCTLTATPNSGYEFSTWTKDGEVVSQNVAFSFTVTEDATYVANFRLSTCIITVNANPTAGGSVTGGGAYNYGQSCTVNAVPNAGYTFVNWTKNGTVVSTSASYTFTVTGTATLVANFSVSPYTITVAAEPAECGTVTGGGSFVYGQTCNLVATPNVGYAFVNWTKNGTVVSTNANYSFTVTESADYVAHFATAQYTITVLAQPVEGGVVYGAGTYDYGTIRSLRAEPNDGYSFVNWTKDGEVISTATILAIIVREDAEYVAHFKKDAYEITAQTDPTGAGSITGIGFYDYGQICTLTVNPYSGYEFINWTLDGEVVSTEASFSFEVTEEQHYVAHLRVDGIEEQETITMTLFPNPAKSKLTIEASETVKSIEVYNINGALVYRQDNCMEMTEINVESFAPGTYMVRLITDNAVAIRRFVKE